MALGQVRTLGLSSPWKWCKVINFCRSQHRAKSPKRVSQLSENTRPEFAEPQVWAGDSFREPRAAGREKNRGEPPPSKTK